MSTSRRAGLISLASRGSRGGGDGHYAIPVTTDQRFSFRNNDGSGPYARDVTQFPGLAFSVSGIDLGVSGLIAFLDPAFDNPVGIVQPYPFLASEVVRWQTPTLEYQNSSDDSEADVTSITGSAATVPLPPTLALFLAGLVAVARSRAATATARPDRSA